MRGFGWVTSSDTVSLMLLPTLVTKRFLSNAQVCRLGSTLCLRTRPVLTPKSPPSCCLLHVSSWVAPAHSRAAGYLSVEALVCVSLFPSTSEP